MGENFTQEAIELLHRKRYLQTAKEALREQIRMLDGDLAACRTASYGRPGIQVSGGNFAEDRMIKLLDRKDTYRQRLRQIDAELEQIRRAYALLSPYQRDLLDTFFASGEKNCAERLAHRYFKERSALYRDRKKALDAFALAVYGAVPY